MKLYLASFLQKENFGPGKIYSICRGNKPQGIDVDQIYLHLTPKIDLIDRYYEMRETEPKTAGETFTAGYQSQLQEFIANVLKDAADEGVSATELLPFVDGDTLCSWERAQYTNYRKILAPFLEKLGYEVISN